MTIKKLTLRLYCTARVHWTDEPSTDNNLVPARHVRFQQCVYDHTWDNLIPMDMAKDPTKSRLRSGSSAVSLQNLAIGSAYSRSTGRARSSSMLSQSSLSPSNSRSTTSLSSTAVNQFPKGNYEFPFHTILDGEAPESVEGFPFASSVYKFEATIERGRFTANIQTKKHLRVVRTLRPDNVELSETMSVDNTWPNKAEYLVNIPSKAIAIGSSVPVSILMVPLLKGLKLGDIKITLCETSSLETAYYQYRTDERIVLEANIPALEITENSDDFEFEKQITDDRWEIEGYLQIPSNLSKCTQNCDVSKYIKIRHKLRFGISLINPDGHISKIRAAIPVSLFISPNITLSCRHEREDLEPGQHWVEENLFEAVNNGNPTQRHLGNGDIQAPPNYSDHIYDRLWCDISPSVFDTPLPSGLTTPGDMIPEAVSYNLQAASDILVDEMQTDSERNLSHALGNLHLAKGSPHYQDVVFSFSPLQNGPRTSGSDDGNQNHSQIAEFSHVSRDVSPSPMLNWHNLDPSKVAEIQSLSRVPSYDTAVKGEPTATATDEPAPSYAPSVLATPATIPTTLTSFTPTQEESSPRFHIGSYKSKNHKRGDSGKSLKSPRKSVSKVNLNLLFEGRSRGNSTGSHTKSFASSLTGLLRSTRSSSALNNMVGSSSRNTSFINLPEIKMSDTSGTDVPPVIPNEHYLNPSIIKPVSAVNVSPIQGDIEVPSLAVPIPAPAPTYTSSIHEHSRPSSPFDKYAGLLESPGLVNMGSHLSPSPSFVSLPLQTAAVISDDSLEETLSKSPALVRAQQTTAKPCLNLNDSRVFGF